MKRKHVLLVLAGVAGLVSCGLAANGLLLFVATALIEGVWTIGILAAAVGLGWVVLRGVWMEGPGLLMLATRGAAGLGVIAIIVMLMGWGGVLNRWTGVGVLAAGPVGWVMLRGWKEWDGKWFEERAEGWWGWGIVAVFGGMALVAASLPPVALWGMDPVPYDALEYHLQVPREWYEGGRIVLLRHNAYGAFPFNVEMHYLLAMHLRGGAWKATYLCQYLTLAHMGLACLAVGGVAATLSQRKWAGSAAAALFVGTPWVVMLGAVAYNEGGMMLYGTVAIGWCLRWVGGSEHQTPNAKHQTPNEERRPVKWLGVAGGMAGLACGVKLTAVPVLLVGVGVVLVVVGGRRAIVGAGVYAGVGLLVFSPWMIRNAAWTGNPVWPEGMKLLGRGHFSERQVERWEVAHSAAEGERSVGARAKAFGNQVVADRQFGWLLWPIAMAGAVVNWRCRRAWFLVMLVGGMGVFWVAFTHLQGRFFVMAIPVAALLAVRLAERWKWVLIGGTSAVALLGVAFVWEGMKKPLQVKPGEVVLFGIEDLSIFLDERTREALKTDGPVALAGDALAYLYPVPMSRLRYRTVMDLDQQDGEDIVEAWVGTAEKGRVVIVSPSELRRFAKTYRNVRVSERWAREPGTVILRE